MNDSKAIKNAEALEADVSSSHAVPQSVLVPEDRHEAHVGLDRDALIQDQDAVGLPGNWLHGVGFLRCILQLLAKVLDLWTRGGIRNISEVPLCSSLISRLF